MLSEFDIKTQVEDIDSLSYICDDMIIEDEIGKNVSTIKENKRYEEEKKQIDTNKR